MRVEENWAVDPVRARRFFLEQADVQAEGDGFRYRSCSIRLTAETGSVMQRWPIARTRLLLEGDEADVEPIRRRFFLRFVSAGG